MRNNTLPHPTHTSRSLSQSTITLIINYTSCLTLNVSLDVSSESKSNWMTAKCIIMWHISICPSLRHVLSLIIPQHWDVWATHIIGRSSRTQLLQTKWRLNSFKKIAFFFLLVLITKLYVSLSLPCQSFLYLFEN